MYDEIKSPPLPELSDICTVHGHQHLGTYKMQAACTNCGSAAVIVLTKEHKVPGWGVGPKCPVCGVRDWTGWKLA